MIGRGVINKFSDAQNGHGSLRKDLEKAYPAREERRKNVV